GEIMDLKEYIKVIQSLLGLVLLLAVVAVAASLYLVADPELTAYHEMLEADKTEEVDKNLFNESDKIVDGIHVKTGLLDGEGLQAVINNCTNCHSAKLVIQNRMNRDRWLSTIRWMQETQNLWPLGENEDVILDYLAKNYPPDEVGRRKNLADIEWYELD
ncbi:MAG: monoheme cytochrome C, partial [Bacteroidota bacterium]